jgi:hypothetical protein
MYACLAFVEYQTDTLSEIDEMMNSSLRIILNFNTKEMMELTKILQGKISI